MIRVNNIYLKHHFVKHETGRIFLDPSQAIEYVTNPDGTIDLMFTDVKTMPDAPQGTPTDQDHEHNPHHRDSE